MKNYYLILCLFFVTSLNVSAQQAKTDTLKFSYEKFMKQEGLEAIKGTPNAQGVAIDLYRVKDNFYMEIPQTMLDKDVLVSMYTFPGYSGYLSEASNLVRFRKGNKNSNMFLTRNRSLDIQNDSLDANIMEAIRLSNLQPIDMVFTIVSKGEKNDSYIIDISRDVNSSNGLFDVSKSGALNSPDAKRSYIVGVKSIEGGFVIDMVRSQGETNSLHFLLQALPERTHTLKQSNPFYGFQTVTRQEYDTKTYVSRRCDYVATWNFQDKKPIVVYLSPIIPQPFVESVKGAFNQWAKAFVAAGIKNPFLFTSDEKDAYIGYKHIYVDWCGVRVNSSIIKDELTGEIVAARLNMNDHPMDDVKLRYYNLCRKNDKRVSSKLLDLGMRKDLLECLLAKEIASIFGLKANMSGNGAFDVKQLRSDKWLEKNGCSASITDYLVFNYVAQPEDGIKPANLLQKVSVYDYDAIAYAYGKSKKAPSLPASYYTPVNEKDYSQKKKCNLSNNILEAAKLGIKNIRSSYETLHRDVVKLKSEGNLSSVEHALALNALVEYQRLIEEVAGVIGKVRVLPVQKGVNDTKFNYTSKQECMDVLNFLNNELLHSAPAWTVREDLKAACGGDVRSMNRGVAVNIYNKWLDATLIGWLVAAENRYGKAAFTASDLFDFINRELFFNFDKTKALPEYERLMIMNVVPALADKAFDADLSLGLTNEGATTLHAYFIQVAKHVRYLAENHEDAATRDAYKMIAMRLNRQYFDRQHK